jgi:hypothetical protein
VAEDPVVVGMVREISESDDGEADSLDHREHLESVLMAGAATFVRVFVDKSSVDLVCSEAPLFGHADKLDSFGHTRVPACPCVVAAFSEVRLAGVSLTAVLVVDSLGHVLHTAFVEGVESPDRAQKVVVSLSVVLGTDLSSSVHACVPVFVEASLRVFLLLAFFLGHVCKVAVQVSLRPLVGVASFVGVA